jgi:2-polyprenyl-3-methyl-5-hydroxy-6-metoxy-1,4-benzoquinol methylase/glycosyltransferase involved in cell wall biosynthesis
MRKLTWAFHIDSVEFTPSVIAGTASLGGSESACLGLARSLQARGHRVHIFTTQLHADAPAKDAWGVQWHPTAALHDLSRFTQWDVFVALRMPAIFGADVKAALRVLWNQDLLTGDAAKNATLALAWAYDVSAYVSHYHRKQWEGVAPELAPIGWVTRNGFDPAYVPKGVMRHPYRIIHITRPERGLRPLLAMWPELKRRVPEAELHLCRYNSMYDAQGWGKVCASYDEQVAAVNAEVGGIVWLGELGKPALYEAIAAAQVMWYPGVADFAETSCVAAIEAQACGTAFVGSWKGALPETAPHGFYVKGDADTPEYQAESIALVERLLTRPETARTAIAAGRQHVQGYTFDAVAQTWEQMVDARLTARLDAHAPAILRQLQQEDDYVAVRHLARQMRWTEAEADATVVIDGKEQVAEDYAARALDPQFELQHNRRVGPVVEALQGTTRVLDVACGNGTFALALAKADPARQVVGVDYAAQNLVVAEAAAHALGVADACQWVTAPVYDFTTHQADPHTLATLDALGPFDGAFIGEFLEHIADVPGFLTALTRQVTPGARMVCTMPVGPFLELADQRMVVKRGHVHHFKPRDIEAIFGQQRDLAVSMLDMGLTPRGNRIGHWIISWTASEAAYGQRDLDATVRLTRPKPSLSVGILAGETIDIRRCLTSVWHIADEIILANTGVDSALLEGIVAEYPRTRILDVGPVHTLPQGFSEARNATLQASTGEWFLWIDTDERLMGPERLRKYLDATVFHGFGLKQQHLQLDMPVTFDTPIRVFRRGPRIQFYGCVHEQPQMDDANGDITPALQLHDVEIAHTGYLNEDIRREKAVRRNLPLLVRDGVEFPTRRLHHLLVLRDHLNLATWITEQQGATETSRNHLRKCIELFETHFADPADKYHALARPFYEQAVRKVQGALEVELVFGAQVQGLKGRVQPERVWVRHAGQIPALLAWKQREWLSWFAPPPPIDVEPITDEVPA